MDPDGFFSLIVSPREKRKSPAKHARRAFFV